MFNQRCRIVCVACFAILTFGLSSTSVARAAEIIDNAKILQMLEAQLDESIIVIQIENASSAKLCRVSATTDELIALKKAGASSDLLKRIIKISTDGQDEARKAVDELLRWAVNNVGEDNQNYRQSLEKAVSYGAAATPHLLKNGLQSNSPQKTVAALDAIGLIGDSALFEDVWRRLFDSNGDVRARAARAVVRLGGSLTDDAFYEKIKVEIERRGQTIDGAIYALGYLKNKKAVLLLVQLLSRDASEDNRAAAAFAIGEIGELSDMAIEQLKNGLLNDASNKVRSVCASSLARNVPNDDSVALAMQRAFQRHTDTRIFLLFAFAKFKYNPILISYLINDVLAGPYDPGIKQAAGDALKEMTGVGGGYATAEEWQGWWRFNSTRPPFNRAVGDAPADVAAPISPEGANPATPGAINTPATPSIPPVN
ncbi:MAG: HEAT repeat domain-containing protein [Planctomycetota bacterium]